MTVLRPGEHADELISASLTGDLTDAERAALDQHLAGCPAAARRRPRSARSDG